MKTSRYIMDEIIKIIAEFVKENELDVSEYRNTVSMTLRDKDVFEIDSQRLGFGGNRFFCLLEFQEGSTTQGDNDYLASVFERIKEIVNSKLGYEKYEFVLIVRNISNKILVEQRVTSMLKRSLIPKGMSARDIEIKPAFIPEQKSIKHSVGIMSNIQNLEYMIEGEHIASIYTAKLYDLVELYNAKGDVLFSDNVRFQIADKLDVDKNIEATLREEPDKFWLYNNGITLLIDGICVDTKKQHSLRITASPTNRMSVINGAQTISAAAHFFYSKGDGEDVIKRAAENAMVVLRVVLCDKKSKRKDLYSQISVSLNRQKAITEADMRYTDQLIDDINTLYEGHKEAPYFYIAREGEQIKKDNVKVSDFAKLSALYLLQQPGLARSSKSKIIKVDDYWNKLRLADYDEKNLDEVFAMKYTPFLYVRALFDVFSKRMKYYENAADEKFAKWCSYGTEFLVAYIVWRLNGGNNDSFALFEARSTATLNVVLVDGIIHTFARYAQELYGEEPIESNITKLDSEYKKVRDHLDENGHDLLDLIEHMKT